jgi:DUF917 family protein
VQNGTHLAATTPDIIALIDEDSGFPLSIEAVAKGKIVSLYSCAAPEIWKSNKGRQVAGPNAFKILLTNDATCFIV